MNEPNSSRNVTKNYSSLKPPTQPKPLKVSEDPGDMARQQMRNQRIISQTLINPEANPGLETWNNKSNGTGNSRGSTLIYNIEDKESNNR